MSDEQVPKHRTIRPRRARVKRDHCCAEGKTAESGEHRLAPGIVGEIYADTIASAYSERSEARPNVPPVKSQLCIAESVAETRGRLRRQRDAVRCLPAIQSVMAR